MRISDWSSDVCSSDLLVAREAEEARSCLVSADVPKVGDVTGSDALRAEIQAHLPGSRISSYKRLAGGFSRVTIALTLECAGEPQNLFLRRQHARSSVVCGYCVSVSLDPVGDVVLNKAKKK